MHLNSAANQHKNERIGPRKASNPFSIQNVITKDNVSISIDAAVYYRVNNARYAHYRITNFNVAIAEVTYAILKNTCGQFILQDILEKRQ